MRVTGARLLIAGIGPDGARAAVMRLLRGELGSGVSLEHDVHGAPLLRGAVGHVSVSHSRSYVAVMLHPCRMVGVDIEEPRQAQLERVAPRFMSALDRERWPGDLLAAWTCKEAVYKAAGTPGLPLADIALTGADEARLPDGRRFALDVDVCEQYTVTTAIPAD